MPVGGSKFELEKTWRSTGVGTQTFNSPGTFTMNYGKQNIYVAGTGGIGGGGTVATYNTTPGTAASYNAGTGLTYNPATVASYNTVPGTVSSYNTVSGTPIYNVAYPIGSYNVAYPVSGYNTVPGNSGYNPPTDGYYYQSTEVGSQYVTTNWAPYPSNVNPPGQAPNNQYTYSIYYSDHAAGVLYPYAPWPAYFIGYYYYYDSYNQQTGFTTVTFQVDRPFRYSAPGNSYTNPPSYPANYSVAYPVGSYNTAYPFSGSYNPPTYPVATYNAPTYPVAAYTPGNAATYNPTNVATYNPPTYPAATYNPFIAGNPSSALGVTMPGGAGGGSYVTPVLPTEISYYSYPDNASYPVTVAPGGQVTIKTN